MRPDRKSCEAWSSAFMKMKKTFFAFALLFVFSLSKAFSFSFDFSVASPAALFVTDYKSRADFFWSSEIPGSFSCNSFLIWFLSLQPAFGVNVPLFSGEAGIRYFYSLGFHSAEISYAFPVLAEKLTLYRDFVLFLEPSFSAGYCEDGSDDSEMESGLALFGARFCLVSEFPKIVHSPYVKAGFEYNYMTSGISSLSFVFAAGLKVGKMVDYPRLKNSLSFTD